MSQLSKIENQLQKAGSLKAALSLDFVQDTFVKNYENITGRKDGLTRFQGEVFALMDIARDNDKIAKCDRFSFFAALVKAGGTGLSFMDNKLYAIPYGNTLKIQISTHGKRELLGRVPGVKRVHEGQYVLAGDNFKHDKMNNRVIEHIAKEGVKLSIENITASYVRIEYNDGSVSDVVVYKDDILAAKKKSKAQNGGPWFDFPGEMAKKVAYNRAYKIYYQKPEGIVDFANEIEGEDISHTEMPDDTPTTAEASQDEPEEVTAEIVDEDTGEVTREKPSAKNFMDED
jgi:phage RecT family recombinase